MILKNKKSYIYLIATAAFILFASVNNLLSQNKAGNDSISPNYWRSAIEKGQKEFKTITETLPDTNVSVFKRYGASAGLSMNVHSANFYELDPINCPSCNKQNYGLNNGFVPFGNVFIEYPFYNSLGFGVYLNYRDLSAKLEVDENITYSFDGIEHDAVIEHILDAKLSMISIEPNIIFRPFSSKNNSVWNNLLFGLGFDAGYIINNNFNQREELEADKNYTFENDSIVRNVRSGKIPSLTSFQLGLSVRLNYEFAINENGTLLLAPEVYYNYPLTNITDNLDWKSNSLVFSIALKFSPTVTKSNFNFQLYKLRYNSDMKYFNDNLQIAIRDSILKIGEKEVLYASIPRITYQDEIGFETETKKITIEQKNLSIIKPFLNFVFFESGKTEIPSRYKLLNSSERKNFEEKELITQDNLDVYYNLLNILGSRMARFEELNKEFSLKIVGCNSNDISEKNDYNISRKRAEAISLYFQNVWLIPKKFLDIEVRNLPENYSEGNDDYANQENSRVEFYSDNKELLFPLQISNEVINKVDPGKVKIYMDGKAGKGIKQWTMTVSDIKSGFESEQTKFNSEVPIYYEWNLQDEKDLPEQSSQLVISFEIFAKDGKEAKAKPFSIPIYVFKPEPEKIEKIAQYSILFPKPDNSISGINMTTANLIQENLKNINIDKAEVSIIGMMDNLDGSEDLSVAIQRAKTTTDYLKLPYSAYYGKETFNKYMNATPEGRFYNRAVDITIIYK